MFKKERKKNNKYKNLSSWMKMNTFLGQLVASFVTKRVRTRQGHLCLQPGLPPPCSEKHWQGSRSLLSLLRKWDSLSLSSTESPSRAIKHTGGCITQLRQREVSAQLGTELRDIASLPPVLLLIKKYCSHLVLRAKSGFPTKPQSLRNVVSSATGTTIWL